MIQNYNKIINNLDQNSKLKNPSVLKKVPETNISV